MNINEVIKKSSYSIFNERYNVAKTRNDCEFSNCFMVVRDELEVTVIYKDSIELKGIISEQKSYRIIAVNVYKPFFSPGFISTLSSHLANNQIPVLVVSTYSRDYFLVKSNHLNRVQTIFDGLGLIKN